MIYVLNFIKIGSGIKKLLRGINIQTHRQQCDFISLLLLLKNKESRLKMVKDVLYAHKVKGDSMKYLLI
jgi:hypothetical protein